MPFRFTAVTCGTTPLERQNVAFRPSRERGTLWRDRQPGRQEDRSARSGRLRRPSHPCLPGRRYPPGFRPGIPPRRRGHAGIHYNNKQGEMAFRQPKAENRRSDRTVAGPRQKTAPGPLKERARRKRQKASFSLCKMPTSFLEAGGTPVTSAAGEKGEDNDFC